MNCYWHKLAPHFICFWSPSLTSSVADVEKFFESVSRSSGGPKAVVESAVSGGIPDNMQPKDGKIVNLSWVDHKLAVASNKLACKPPDLVEYKKMICGNYVEVGNNIFVQ